MNYFTSPKSDFIKDGASVINHHKIIENPLLRKHMEIALMEMQRRAAAGTDSANFNLCAASHLRLLGAQDFMEIFYNLAEQMQPGVRTDTANLPANIPAKRN